MPSGPAINMGIQIDEARRRKLKAEGFDANLARRADDKRAKVEQVAVSLG